MSAQPSLQPILDDLDKRFGPQIEETQTLNQNEVHLHTRMESVAPLCAFFYRIWEGRLISVFAEDARERHGAYLIHYVFALDSAHAFFIVRAPISPDHTEFPSLTNAVHAVNWQEREIQDLFGLKLIGHPNPRRCALHDDWPDVYPLRKDFDLRAPLPAFTGERHKFREVEGEGVFQVPVGPVHAGIIEPGHFLFSVAGEPVLYLQIRLAYTHKGTEKLFENLPVAHGVRLAESISGDSSFAHATAFCHAIERVAQVEVPRRAKTLRSVCLELERIYNHIADIGAIATDVAFVVANAHAMRLKEKVLRLNERVTGSRLLRGMVCLGGVRFDWNPDQVKAISRLLAELEPEFDSLVNLIQASASTRDRLEGTGILTSETARDLGVVGIAGRASGFDHDLRRDFPHAAYDRVKFVIPVYEEGDVLHRMQVRVDEVRQSFGIIRQLLEHLPGGELRAKLGDLPPDRVALGYVEGWRGEIIHWIRTAPGNRLARCKVKDPSLQNWPALSEAILGNIVPDFPVINKSFNLSVLRYRPLIMLQILRKSFATGVVTTNYPQTPPEISSQARGRPEIDFTNWKDARPAATVCPTGAIVCKDKDGVRKASLDLGKCTFCGLCAEADAAIRMTNVCELAVTQKNDLKTSVRYQLRADSTHEKLLEDSPAKKSGPDAVPFHPQEKEAFDALGQKLKARIDQVLGRSLHIREVDAGSCNGCEIEIVGLNSPVYDLERFGIHFVASPRHADMLLVTGPVTRNMELALRKTYDATPEPRLVVAVGACGCSGGIFGQNYASLGGVDKVIPVDVYIPGCPPNPHALLHGILMAIGRLAK